MWTRTFTESVLTGNSPNPPKGLRNLRPQAVASCPQRRTPANHPAECNEDNDNDNAKCIIILSF